MTTERYAEIMAEFEILLRYGIEVSNRLIGTSVKEKHLSYADTIYTKLLCHAISLQKLSPTAKEKPMHELWDFPSACAIARCIIEAYDVLGYIVLSKIPQEVRDFRLLIWRLHDKQRRSKMLHAIHSKDPKANEIHEEAKALASEAIQHPWYKNVPKHLQKKIADGDAPSFLLSQRDLNKENSIDHEYHVAATMWLSQYVHTFPMALHQLFEFKAGTPDALRISSIPLQYASGFMAKSIIGMASTFTDVNMIVNGNDVKIFKKWCLVLENGVSIT